MPKFRGQKNLHVGEDVHAVRDHEGGGYVIDVDAETAELLTEYLATEGFHPADAEPAEEAEDPDEPAEDPDAD